jgi:isopentenyl-diphosphate delta-isomerase type 1
MVAGMEIFDVVDEQDRVIGQAPRTEVHARGWRHRAVHIWLFNPRGELFVQKRAAGKDTFPNSWDSSASGHVDTGEEYDACAVRELREELGMSLPVTALTRCFKITACADTGQEFVWVYRLVGDYRPIINPTEIAGGEFWSPAKLRAVIEREPASCARSFCRVWREFGACSGRDFPV